MEGRRILFVEDEAPLLALLSEALQDEGFDVTTARTGADALGMLALAPDYDAVVSDISMPDGVSGIDLARRARELQPQARIILASGLARSQLPALPDRVTFLPKPYRLRELLAELAREETTTSR